MVPEDESTLLSRWSRFASSQYHLPCVLEWWCFTVAGKFSCFLAQFCRPLLAEKRSQAIWPTWCSKSSAWVHFSKYLVFFELLSRNLVSKESWHNTVFRLFSFIAVPFCFLGEKLDNSQNLCQRLRFWCCLMLSRWNNATPCRLHDLYGQCGLMPIDGIKFLPFRRPF